ncbi:uncharacterized protein LOC132561421 [Ylistrum balloti]|uniref:uncharacterized protein LOC132561421 n=1 Tax=Ylistrum balloti TaxID=509963 RepID=UPI002905F36E|nr:uncharacterized protein LOC132561421 [Ylistrum balloti]
MAEPVELYDKSWILYHVLERMIGRREEIVLKQNMMDWRGYDFDCLSIGSSAEGGKNMPGSDIDLMLILKHIVVCCQDHDVSNPSYNENQTIFVMRDADSRPGYVNLKLAKFGQIKDTLIADSIVSVNGEYFISSEIFNNYINGSYSGTMKFQMDTNGPAATLKHEQFDGSSDLDFVYSFPCYTWPKEAKEWITRPRFHNWPDKTLMDQIVRGGCHLVPVGDKTSDDPFLQWRISFVTAERQLIHSLSHVQFLVYGLLKYFLKQISGELKQLQGDTDILTSYIMKTVILYTVENTSESLWQEKHIFVCFMLCLNTLISWVMAGYCPNYFVNNNNMFLGKVNRENQTRLLHFLLGLREMAWGCLSVGALIQPSIGEHIDLVENGVVDFVLPLPTQLEKDLDRQKFGGMAWNTCKNETLALQILLSTSKSDDDEFIRSVMGAKRICYIGMKTFGEHAVISGNKEKYKSLRKSKNLLKPLASICASPGLLTLATYHYQTGNYVKALEISGDLISSRKVYFPMNEKSGDKYESLYCGHGYTLQQKLREGVVFDIILFTKALQFFPCQLHPEVVKYAEYTRLPPLPYAAFLSFLCYHELGDTRRRDAALTNLRIVKYDEYQGGGERWAVHILLGICYEMAGDKENALREYNDSLRNQSLDRCQNTAKERIKGLLCDSCRF